MKKGSSSGQYEETLAGQNTMELQIASVSAWVVYPPGDELHREPSAFLISKWEPVVSGNVTTRCVKIHTYENALQHCCMAKK